MRVWRALVLAVAAAAIAAPFAGAAPVARQERGKLVLENVPEAPAAVKERLRQYVNTRAALFQDWTPEGGLLITTRFGEAAQVHQLSQPMGARRQRTFYSEPIALARARPRGQGFMVSKDQGGDELFQGLLVDPVSGRAQAFTEPGSRNESFVWADDGRRIAWARALRDSPDYVIQAADPSDPASRRTLFAGKGQIVPIDWSADGRYLLLGAYVSIAKSRRFVLDVNSGAARELTPELSVSYEGGEFTPDGRAVIVTSDEGGPFRRLVRLDLASGARTPLSPPGLNWNVEAFDLAPDGRTLAYVVNAGGGSTLRLIDLARGRELAPALPAGVIPALGFDPQGKRLAFTLDSATAPGDIWTFTLKDGALTRWTESETGGIDPKTFVAPSLVSWPSFDGRAISGFLYAPRTPGPHPVVISIHGGPEAQFRPSFSATIQYWVNELGLAVIAPNVRGSDGYGKDFLALDNGVKREDAVADIGALLDWIAAEPRFDARRVAVQGGSYGGYMALASMTKYNDRLAGGVAVVGISNFVTFLENTSGYRRDLRRAEYGDERDPAMRAALIAMSPLTHVSKITKPLFVVQGLNDPRVPVTEAEQVLAAVRANGGEAWYMLATDEGHGFRKKQNQEAQREAETMFFQKVLAVR